MLGDLDMIVELTPTALPLGIFVGLARQWQQRRTIELVEELMPAATPAPQRPIVQIGQKAADCLVESRKREEALVPQPRQNPAADDLYSHLDFRFVLRMMRPCWQYGGAIMASEIRVGAVDHRFVEARPADAGL